MAEGTKEDEGTQAGYQSLQTDTGIVLDQPDLQQMKHDRFQRNLQFMTALNKSAAEEAFPHEKVSLGKLEDAAICIQKYYRGYLGRKRYIELLYDQFSKEEKVQLDKSLAQMEEAELLVENHKLEVLLDDDKTTRRNKARNYLANVITIQRAWRVYASKKHLSDTDVDLTEDLEELKIIYDGSEKDSMTATIATEDDVTGDCNPVVVVESLPQDTKEFNTSREVTPDSGAYASLNSPAHRLLNKLKQENDTDLESVSSDYSEIAVPLKDLAESEVTVIEKDQLVEGSFMQQSSTQNYTEPAARKSFESEEDYNRRLRKINFLSIAQEFAELKKVNSDILPFDLHKGQGYISGSSCSDTSSIPSQKSSEMNTPCDPSESFVQLNNGVNNFMSTDLNRNFDANVQGKGDNSFSSEQNNKHLSIDNATQRTSGDDAQQLQKPTNRNSNTTENLSSKGDNSNVSVNSNREDNSGKEPEGDFDVYNIETTLPQMNWDMLEQQLQQVTQQQERRQESQRNDREEIRRKLAMGLDEEYYGGERSFRKPNLSTRLQSGMNLQICFMNETPGEEPGDSALKNSPRIGDSTQECQSKAAKAGLLDATMTTIPDNGNGEKEVSEKEDFFKKQARLQREAKIALAQASTMAHMQLEVEKQNKKKSPVADIVGLPVLSQAKGMQYGTRYLHEMNVGQLQVLVNDLHCQIENLNEDLVKLLMERDELHMGQDSMLVDIEDLTRRAEAKAKKMNLNQKTKKDSRRS